MPFAHTLTYSGAACPVVDGEPDRDSTEEIEGTFSILAVTHVSDGETVTVTWVVEDADQDTWAVREEEAV